MIHILRDTIFIACLIRVSVTDLKRYEVPDKALLTAFLAWIFAAPFLWDRAAPLKWCLPYLLSGLGAGAFPLAVSLLLDRILKKDTLGGGDIKLFALAGLYTGSAGAYLTVFLSCLVGLCMTAVLTGLKKKNSRFAAGLQTDETGKLLLPFAPAISLAAVIALYTGEGLWNWYLRLF